MKVEERTEKEKEEIKNRKRELFTDQKKKKQDIKILHIQMRRVEEYETWEKSKKQEANFIRTKADPPLYWLPKTISDKSIGTSKSHFVLKQSFNFIFPSLELQQATRQLVEKEVATRKEEFEEELLEIERKMTIDLDRSRNGPRGDIRDRLDTSKVQISFRKFILIQQPTFYCRMENLMTPLSPKMMMMKAASWPTELWWRERERGSQRLMEGI